MISVTTNYLDAIAHLPVGGTLSFENVPWEEYEELLDNLGAGYRVRITYDHGRLEIMSPLPIHERQKECFSRMAHILTEELGLDLESLGSTTYKQEEAQHGLEPDTCFYIQNAARTIGKRVFDLDVDPAPDIAVEIDITSESIGRFHIYAALGVPEIWRYDEKRVEIYQLNDTAYVPAPHSPSFPFLTGEVLLRFLQQSLAEGQSAALRAFREWVRASKPPAA
ncbi:MAG: Uma2 family endonuclease [Blastocatellia bacterium]